MEDSEKLTALKKAYAEIILNTAKEAAARIMVSEKKALRLQQELFSTKEEALRMLLRLKQMLDSKVTEAEMTSLSQQKKIEELDAQLQEAEDIVRDLREELGEVQDKLENVTNDQLQPLDQNLEGDTAIREEISQENGLMTSGSIFSLPDSGLESLTTSDMKNLTSNGTHLGNNCYGVNDQHMDNCYLPNPYFASIVMRSKEPELYRNGFTQRIPAFEKYLLYGKSLGEELREVQDKLENVTNDQLQSLDEQNKRDTAVREEISQENGLMTSGSILSLPDSRPESFTTSDMKNLTSNGTHPSNKCYGENDSHMDNCYLPNPYFASIVMRSKEPELYRNGCTQRIRAFEKYLLYGKSLREELREVQDKLENVTNDQLQPLDEQNLEGDSAIREEISQEDDVKNEVFTRGDEEGKKLYKISIHRPYNMLGVEEKNQDGLKVMHEDGSQIPVQAVKSIRRKRRKRATKYQKSKAPSCEQVNGMCVIPTQESENMLGVEEKNLDEVKLTQPNRSDIHLQIVKSFCRKRKQAARYVKSNAPSCRSLADQVMEMRQASDLSNSKTSSDSVDNNEELVKNPSKVIENEGQTDPVSTVATMLLSDATGMDLGSVDVTENDVEFVKACGVRNTMNKGTALINKLDVKRQESLSAENSEVQGCRTDVETFDESLVNLDLKASDSNDVVGQTVTTRFLKYTFRRKRKKESLCSPDGSSSLDSGTLKRETGEKQNGSLEPQSSSLITESSRDSRRLAQVARQLISLSEKKWWQ